MKLHPYLMQRMDQLNELCRKHGVARLYAFGSIVSGAFDVKTSDIDLQVELLPLTDPVTKGLTLLEFWDELEELFEKKVDLLTDQPIKNPFFRKILEETKILVYDRASQEVPV
ncbi:MAG: nucleotidyltransferase domain-containing protein [Saprospiraceae bacterium]|nr:nucleotidyltransferase domain-containing protein [Saprospiraceae bacterium]